MTLRDRALLEAISDAVIAIDDAGTVLYWGPGATELYGRAAPEMLGRPLCDSHEYRWERPEDAQRAWAELERVGRWRGRNVHVLRAGGERHVESTVTVLHDEQGRRIGLLAVIRDDGARAEAERARRAAEEALRQSEVRARLRAAELETVLDTVPAAVWIARDPRGDHIDANRFGAELLRRRPGENVSVTAPGADRPRHFVPEKAGQRIADDDLPIQRAARSGEEVRGAEVDLRFEDGELRHLLGNAAPLPDGEGGTKGSVGAFIDITDRKRAEEALREADRRKTDFLALLSHELRNPLAAIRNGLVLLDRAAANAAMARRAKDVLRRQADQLSRLVDDLLDISRIAHGKIEVELALVDARDVVRRACADAKGLFEQRDVDLLLSDPDEPLWVRADAARFAQMLGNLLHNALKFTPPRGQVEVRLARRGAACEVRVRDSGLGIDPADLQRIFDPFTQVDRTRRGHGGLGLGLALVRELASKHGGAVHAESAGVGMGAELVLQLPLADGRDPDPTLPPRARGATGLSVLVVEDNEDAGETLVELLAIGGHAARLAKTGAAALEAAASSPPHVLVCDIGLPDMSGHEVIRAIRATPSGRALYAIALTGYAQPEDRAVALAAGFDAHLAKPPPLEELEELLSAAARRRPPDP